MTAVTGTRKGLPITHMSSRIVISPDALSVGVHSYEEATFPDGTKGKNGHTDNFAKTFSAVQKICVENGIPYELIMTGITSIFELMQAQRLEELANPVKIQRTVV